MNEILDYDEIDGALRDLGFRLDAAEYHGALCGVLCVQADASDDLGLETDAPANEDAVPAARELLQTVRQTSFDHLHDPESGFTPLLPQDDEALDQRVDALAQWCQGFLYGLSTRPALDLNETSPELREVVNDLIQISRAGVEPEVEPDEDADENAYMELVEYVRAGVQLVFLELRPTITPAADDSSVSSTLH